MVTYWFLSILFSHEGRKGAKNCVLWNNRREIHSKINKIHIIQNTIFALISRLLCLMSSYFIFLLMMFQLSCSYIWLMSEMGQKIDFHCPQVEFD